MFPVMLCLRGERCLVVGGGSVALRKVESLLSEGARVTAVAPRLVPRLVELAAAGEMVVERRRYRGGEAKGFALVFAATDDREINRQVEQDARSHGIWVNVADDPELCSFHLPARVQRGPLQLAIASGGEAPFLVRRLRQVLEGIVGPAWKGWAEAAASFRGLLRRQSLTPEAQEAAYDAFFAATVDSRRLAVRVPGEHEMAGWAAVAKGGRLSPGSQPGRGGPIASEPSPGLVSLVGAGPGDSGLLTVRGLARLRAADAVVYDRLAAPALPGDLPPSVELHAVGKEAGHHPVPQGAINALLVALARQGKRVVRLKGGDPYVFGRGGEEALELRAAGVPFEVVPGVTAGVAVPAAAGIPVTQRGEAVAVSFFTAHESAKETGPQVSWSHLGGDPNATLVGYMGVGSLSRVVDRLIAAGTPPDTPAALIERGTMAAQRSVLAPLASLPEVAEKRGVEAPALLVVGRTVGHAVSLECRQRLPLNGERLVVTSPSGDLAEALELGGAELVAVSVPLTPAGRVAIAAAPVTGWLLRSVAELDGLVADLPGNGGAFTATVWCMGEQTAAEAVRRGVRGVEAVEGALAASAVVEMMALRRLR